MYERLTALSVLDWMTTSTGTVPVNRVKLKSRLSMPERQISTSLLAYVFMPSSSMDEWNANLAACLQRIPVSIAAL
jgi:hypothetical protein